MYYSFKGWWLVDRDGELGWAPASHLEPTDDGAEITASRTFAPGQGRYYTSLCNLNMIEQREKTLKQEE